MFRKIILAMTIILAIVTGILFANHPVQAVEKDNALYSTYASRGSGVPAGGAKIGDTKVSPSDGDTTMRSVSTKTNSPKEKPAAAQAVIKAKKVLEGDDLTAYRFKFILKNENGQELEEVTNTPTGDIIFKPLIFKEEGVFRYTIEEDKSVGYEGITYAAPITVTITVTKNAANALVATIEGTEGQRIFKNIYTPANPIQVVLEGKTVLEGKPLEAGKYSFELLDDKGMVLQTVQNDAKGNIRFAPITYTEEAPYQNIYVVRAVEGSEPGVTYSKDVYEVEVNVYKEDHETLVANVTKRKGGQQAEIIFTNKYITSATTTTTSTTQSTTTKVTTTAVAPATTTAEPSTSRIAPATTTAEPSTSRIAPATTTTEPSTSRIAPATTTAEPSTSRIAPATTTAEPSTSRIAPATTTAEPSTSRIAPATTTAEPSTSRIAPATTTAEPSTSRIAPATTTAEPSTSRIAPATTTAEPSTSRIAPATTTAEPSTSRIAPATTTTEPSTSRIAPATTTAEPSTSRIAPATTTTNAAKVSGATGVTPPPSGKKGKALPKTGEESGLVMTLSGVSLLAVVSLAGVLYRKLKKSK